MSDAEPPTRDPNWPLDALRALAHEISDYFVVVWQTTAHPRRFYAEWAAGERRALNPLAATLNSVAVMAVWALILRHALHVPSKDETWWLELTRPILETARACAFGVACHFAVWIFGARRPLRTTIGAVLLCSAGVQTLFGFFFTAFEIVTDAHHGPLTRSLRVVQICIICLVMGVTLSALPIAIASAQDRKGWRIVVPVLLTILGTGVLFLWTGLDHPILEKLLLG